MVHRSMIASEVERRARSLLERYRSPAILLDRVYPPAASTDGHSHFGGLPSLPDGFEWPRTAQGIPLHFLFQLDCGAIGWPTPLPRQGVLFFFGRDDAEQRWGEGAPQDDCRVLYAPSGVAAERPTPEPDELPPIGWHYVRGPLRDVQLTGEAPRRVHVRWPARLSPMESFPDLSGLPSVIAHDEKVNRRFMREYRLRKFLRRFLSGVSAFPRLDGESPETPVWDRYEALLPAARASALEAATAHPIHEEGQDILHHGGARQLFAEAAFPHFWIFIHFFARAALRRTRRSGIFDLPPPNAEELARRAEADDRLDAEATAWFERSCAVPLESAPGSAERLAFRSWAASIERHPLDREPGSSATEWTRVAALWAVREWAGDPALAAKLPDKAYACVADLFPLGCVQRGEDKDWYSLSASQSLGHAPAAQAAEAADGDVCLLNLASDRGLGWSFGDAGACSFWISRADLAECDFSWVRGTIVGH